MYAIALTPMVVDAILNSHQPGQTLYLLGVCQQWLLMTMNTGHELHQKEGTEQEEGCRLECQAGRGVGLLHPLGTEPWITSVSARQKYGSDTPAEGQHISTVGEE